MGQMKKPEEADHLLYLSIDGKIILKLILRTEGLDWNLFSFG
jgi:hypothetical protein